jgi:hypothetical protein
VDEKNLPLPPEFGFLKGRHDFYGLMPMFDRENDFVVHNLS